MILVVADGSPIRFLVVIDVIQIVPRLYAKPSPAGTGPRHRAIPAATA